MSADLKMIFLEALDEYFSEKEVTVSEAARRLNKTRPTIHKMIRRGELEKTKTGITLKSIIAWKRKTTGGMSVLTK